MLSIINKDHVFVEFPQEYPPIFHDKNMKAEFETFGIRYHGRTYRLPTQNDPDAQSKYTLFLNALKESYPDRKLQEKGFQLLDTESKV